MHPLQPQSILRKFMNFIHQWNVVTRLKPISASKFPSPDNWLPPPNLQLKLKFDGSSFHKDVPAGLGGIFRNGE